MPLTGQSLNPPIGSKNMFRLFRPFKLGSPGTVELTTRGALPPSPAAEDRRRLSLSQKVVCWYVAYDILELLLQLHVSHQVLAEKSSGHTLGVGQMLQFV